MATHSSVLAWRIPGTGEPGGLLSMGSHRVGHDWSNLTAAAATWFLIHICEVALSEILNECQKYKMKHIMHCRKAKWSSELEPEASLGPVPHSCDSQVALVVKNLPAKVGDTRDKGLILGSERSPGRGNGNPLQYSCLKSPMDRGAWCATVHEVTKPWTQLRN